MKILVVDDDVVSRMVLMHMIDRSGNFDIVQAQDGMYAWQQLENGLRPALCFCDLRMPELSGMQLLERIRVDPVLCAMPFVMMSAAAEYAAVRQASEAGASAYLVKPFGFEQVQAHLKALLLL